MGNHRADRRGHRRPSSSPRAQGQYAGRRVAGRPAPSASVSLDSPLDQSTLEETTVATPLGVIRSDLAHRADDAETADLPRVAAPGKRRAVRQVESRGPLSRLLPTAPVAIGITTLAIAVGGAVTSTGDTQLAASPTTKFQAASALGGAGGVAKSTDLVGKVRSAPVSRDSRRDALESVADTDLVAAAEKQAEQRNAALGQLAEQAEQQAEKIASNQWVYPLEPVVLTARFGQYGLWSSYHTGLDFNGNTGDAIKAIANGVVTSVGYDGSYGNKTVVTLDDGTELWYCHQTSYLVSAGDTVRAGEVIGTVGTTGNVTGSHLHVEVRPGGGDPVDPYAAMRVHGLF